MYWIKDHKGDFQIAANRVWGKEIDVDWSDIRMICLAPEYKKYDLHAVQVMGANIEVLQYKTYENGILNIEEVYKRTTSTSNQETEDFNGKNPVKVEAGEKAALTRKTATYSIDQHIEGIDALILDFLI